jgi:hypothetical protein
MPLRSCRGGAPRSRRPPVAITWPCWGVPPASRLMAGWRRCRPKARSAASWRRAYRSIAGGRPSNSSAGSERSMRTIQRGCIRPPQPAGGSQTTFTQFRSAQLSRPARSTVIDSGLGAASTSAIAVLETVGTEMSRHEVWPQRRRESPDSSSRARDSFELTAYEL